MKSYSPITLVALFSLASIATAQTASDPGKISGQVFGDAFTVVKHHDSSIKGSNGLWFRRINLIYDKVLTKGISARLRLEALSPGDFKSESTMQTFFKDAYIQFDGNGYVVLAGLIPTATITFLETSLGYRPVEKTPLDLYKMGEPRDQGIALKGATADKKLAYHVAIGTASGTRGRTGKGNAEYGSVAFKITPELTLEAYVDHAKKTSGTTWTTEQGSLVYKGKGFNAGLTLASQKRKTGAGHYDIGFVSLYLDKELSNGTKPFFRMDVLSNAIPNADTIPYLILSKDGKPTLFLAGIDFKLANNVHLIPNIEHVSYRKFGAAATPRSDTFLRITFSYSF